MHADLSFITSGKVAAIVGGQRLAPMRRGQFFGEIAVVSHCENYLRRTGGGWPELEGAAGAASAPPSGASGAKEGFVGAGGDDMQNKRTADVVCVENCDLLELKADTVMQLMASAPTLIQALHEVAQQRLHAHSPAPVAFGGAGGSSPVAGYDPRERYQRDGYDDFPTMIRTPSAPAKEPGSPLLNGGTSPGPAAYMREDSGYASSANGREASAGSPAPLNQRRAKLLQDALSKLPPQNSSDLPLARQFEAASRRTAAIRYDVDPKKRWETLHALAKGSSGSVFLARPKDPEMQARFPQVAIKKFNLSGDLSEFQDLISEIRVMSISVHPNIVEYVESYQWGGRGESGTRLWVVMEAMTHGALNVLLDRSWPMWSGQDPRQLEACIAYVQREALQGLAYLHSYSRIHRDIKSDNILLGPGGAVKLGDLGFCVQLTRDSPSRKSVLGTPYWMAPEVIREKPYGLSADIWSLGVVLRECTSKDPPYFDMTVFRAMYLISTKGAPPLAKKASGGAWSKDLIKYDKMCLRFNSYDRPSCQEALRHPFLAQACPPDVFEQVILFCKATEKKTKSPKIEHSPKMDTAAKSPIVI